MGVEMMSGELQNELEIENEVSLGCTKSTSSGTNCLFPPLIRVCTIILLRITPAVIYSKDIMMSIT